MKIKIAIFYQYFLPAYKAGGPIQSIANLCRQLGGDYQMYIICGSQDHNENEDLPNIKTDSWNDFENGKASVYYISKENSKRRTIKNLLKEINPEFVFINGIYSPLFTIAPLVIGNYKKILSVRGMLHPGALSQKRIKKKIFISILKFLQLSKKVVFHATDEGEKKFIQNIFGKKSKVFVAQNFPNIKTIAINSISKDANKIKLISIGLISPMKNHALVLKALINIKADIVYDIYGPVKDPVYWQQCLELIKKLPANILLNYKGSINPNKVENILTGYHLFILPSKSENFGHAIYEALSSGVPVITSNNTPWKNLKENSAGYNVEINDASSISNTIEHFASFNNDQYQVFAKGAVEYAKKKIDIRNIKLQYQKLFS